MSLGVQNTYAYLMIGDAMELLIKLLFVIILTCSLGYTIINFKKLFQSFQSEGKKQGFLYALYFSIYLALFFNPVDPAHTEVTVFKRVIGIGLSDGIDVSKRIRNFNCWFICLAVLFVLFSLLANYFKSRNYSEENKKVIKFLDNVIILANVIQGIRCISHFYDESQETSVFYYSEYLIMTVLLLGIAYIVLSLEKKICMERYIQLIVSGMMLSYPLAILVTNLSILGYQEWDSGRILMGMQIAVSALLTIIVKFVNVNWEKKYVSTGLVTVVICLSFIPFCTSFFIELITILNQYEIFVSDPGTQYFRAVMVGIAFTVILTVFACRKNVQIKYWKNVSYPVIIFGIVCLWKQIDTSAIYDADLFESANFSVLISDFLNFGDIPLVEHYGGHMMTGVWEGIIYALLNNDYYGAIFSPYSEYVATVITVLFFFLMKHVCEDDDLALLITLFFPFYESIDNWGLGILACLAVMAFIKKNSYKRAILFWLALVWCTLYRLDLGFAFVIASIATLILYVLFDKNMKAAKQLVLTLFFVGAAGVTIWCILCVVNGVNPLSRLLEFLLISASNQNWAFSGIGDNTLSRFAWAYLFVPFAVVICLVCIVFSKTIRVNVGKERWALLLILGFSFLANYSRGLVRHSMVENALQLIMWTAYVFFALFIVSIKSNYKLFVPMFSVFILCNTLFLSETVFSERSIADCSAERIGTFTETWKSGQFSESDLAEEEKGRTYWEQIANERKVIERVRPENDLKNTINVYQAVMDALLEDHETFVDFTNKTFVYSAINRQNPVYVSQSPLQLSGEFTQEAFIKEIENVPVVLMPLEEENDTNSKALDGIANSVRYYKIAEYIYQNYVPLCRYEEDFAIWCLKERYNEMVQKVKVFSESGIELKDAILSSDNIVIGDAEVVPNDDGSININSIGMDPVIGELQNIFDVTPYVDSELKISVQYETDVSGLMQMFYTTDDGENYNEDKLQSVVIDGSGTAYFTIPITQYSRIRLDTPEGSKVTIRSFKIDVHYCNLIDYGYDGPYLDDDGVEYRYITHLHSYSVNELPRIWAEGDKEESTNNEVISTLVYTDGVFQFDASEVVPGNDGNYLKVNISYAGKNKEDDYETISADLKIGNYDDGRFETKYTYNFTVKEGQHEYMFRISNDYYWYLKQVNATMLECEEKLLGINMEILEGD